MPRLSFSVLSLYPIPSNRPPLSLPTFPRLFYLSPSLQPLPLQPCRAISIPLGLAPLVALGLASLFVNTGRQPGTTEPNFNEDCASESTASIGETLVSLCPLFLLPFRSNFRMKIIARFRGGSLSNAPFFYRPFSSSFLQSQFLLSFWFVPTRTN